MEVLPDLIMKGAMRHIDLAMVEFHNHTVLTDPRRIRNIAHLKEAVVNLAKVVHKPNFMHLDDESYSFSNVPLPQCTKKKLSNHHLKTLPHHHFH